MPEGGIVALLGSNGAGKTTLLRAISGLLDIHEGEVTKGSITLDGTRLAGRAPAEVVRSGVTQVLEGRRIFAELTVEENLRIGAHTQRGDLDANVERVYALFDVLKQRRKATAGYLSGGEQQMLAMGRAMMSAPRYLLLDEPSLGLAPLLVRRIRDLIVDINATGTTVLLVEQNANMALQIADHGYVLGSGKIVMDKPAAALRDDKDVREFYLGLGDEGPEVVPRRQALQAARAVAVVSAGADGRLDVTSRRTLAASLGSDLGDSGDDAPVLVFDDVQVSFAGVTAIDGVSFDVRPRELLAIIGPNGAGKTSIFNVFSGVYRP